MRYPHPGGHRWITVIAVVLIATAFPQAARSETIDATAVATSAPIPVRIAQARHRLLGERKRKALIDLNLNLQSSVPMGTDQLVPHGAPGEGVPLFWGGSFTVNATDKLRFFENRINHEDVAGQRYKKGLPSYAGLDWDIEYQHGLGYNVSRNLDLEEMYIYRYRACCPNTADPTNAKPRSKQGWETAITGRVGPETAVGRMFQLRGEATWVDHHPDVGLGLPGGTPVPGNLWIYKLAGTAFFPVHGRTFVPYLHAEHYDDFFTSELTPTITNRSEFGFIINGSPLISYRVYVRNDHEIGGDVSHKVDMFFIATLHLHS